MTVAAGIAGAGSNLSSDLLTKLVAERKALWKEMLKHEDPDTEDAKNAKMALWAKEGEIKAEKASLQKAENDAKMQEQRNQRIGLNNAQFAAYDALNAEKAKKQPDAAKVAELQTAFDTAKELVNNELLAKFAGSSPKKEKSENGEKTGKAAVQKAEILALFAAGKLHKEIEAAGYARSTVWHVLNNAVIAGEITKTW